MGVSALSPWWPIQSPNKGRKNCEGKINDSSQKLRFLVKNRTFGKCDELRVDFGGAT